MPETLLKQSFRSITSTTSLQEHWVDCWLNYSLLVKVVELTTWHKQVETVEAAMQLNSEPTTSIRPGLGPDLNQRTSSLNDSKAVSAGTRNSCVPTSHHRVLKFKPSKFNSLRVQTRSVIRPMKDSTVK